MNRRDTSAGRRFDWFLRVINLPGVNRASSVPDLRGAVFEGRRIWDGALYVRGCEYHVVVLAGFAVVSRTNPDVVKMFQGCLG